MSFLTTLEDEATLIEQEVVSGAKTVLNYVDNVFVTEIEPALVAALKQALSTLEQAVIAAFLQQISTPKSAASTELDSTAAPTG